MRLADEASPGGDPSSEMRALAAEFPGALRELDETPLEVLRERARELERCLRGECPPSPWMTATLRYHALTRGALAAKRWLGRTKASRSAADYAREISGTAYAEDGLAWAGDLARVASPPAGRLMTLVFERLASELGVTVDEARALALGPASKRKRR